MKILISCNSFSNLTGSEISNFELAKELSKLDNDVSIITYNLGNPLMQKAINEGIKVYNVNINPPNFRKIGVAGFMKISDKFKFDVLHLNHFQISNRVLELYKDTPAVMHVRSEVIQEIERPILNPNIKKYISIRPTINDYIKSFGISENDIFHVDNPFNVERFNQDYIQEVNEKKVTLYVGTIDFLRKNMLFDIAKKIKSEDGILWIIGKNHDTYLDTLLENPSVQFLGEKPNIEDYMKKCDETVGIFRGRSTIEGFLCGKGGWIYQVDKYGNVLSKEFTSPPDDLFKYSGEYSAKKIMEIYNQILQ